MLRTGSLAVAAPATSRFLYGKLQPQACIRPSSLTDSSFLRSMRSLLLVDEEDEDEEAEEGAASPAGVAPATAPPSLRNSKAFEMFAGSLAGEAGPAPVDLVGESLNDSDFGMLLPGVQIRRRDLGERPWGERTDCDCGDCGMPDDDDAPNRSEKLLVHYITKISIYLSQILYFFYLDLIFVDSIFYRVFQSIRRKE